MSGARFQRKSQTDDEARLVRAKADKAEIEVSEKRGGLIDIKAVEKEWIAMALAFRNKMLSLPTSLAAELSDQTSPTEIEAILKRAITDALSELHKGRLSDAT